MVFPAHLVDVAESLMKRMLNEAPGRFVIEKGRRFF